MSMSKADAQAAMVYDLGEREVGGVDIVVALDHLQVRGDLTEKLICLAVGQVTQAEDLADLSGCEELAELARIDGSVERAKAIMIMEALYLGREILTDMG